MVRCTFNCATVINGYGGIHSLKLSNYIAKQTTIELGRKNWQFCFSLCVLFLNITLCSIRYTLTVLEWLWRTATAPLSKECLFLSY